MKLFWMPILLFSYITHNCVSRPPLPGTRTAGSQTKAIKADVPAEKAAAQKISQTTLTKKRTLVGPSSEVWIVGPPTTKDMSQLSASTN